MPFLTFTLRVTSDVGAEPQVVYEKILRLALNEEQVQAVVKAGGDTIGVYTTIPSVNTIPILNACIVATDQPVNIKFASVSTADGVIALKAGGLVAVIDGNIGAGATLNALINNVGVNAANLTVLSGGT
jgi:hypothetical protein